MLFMVIKHIKFIKIDNFDTHVSIIIPGCTAYRKQLTIFNMDYFSFQVTGGRGGG